MPTFSSEQDMMARITELINAASSHLDLNGFEYIEIVDRWERLPIEEIKDQYYSMPAHERHDEVVIQDEKKHKLNNLPVNLWQVTDLLSLDLSNNQLANLPPEIGQLKNLISLNLSHNKLTELPREIGQLVDLQELILNDNQLTILPDEIGQLINLKLLIVGNEVSGNKLSALPSNIGNLIKLQQLDLDNNRLTVLPSEIGELADLIILGISRNQLTSLPSEIGRLRNLRNIRLGYNHLIDLPHEIGNLVNLQKLWLNGNKISALPSDIKQLTSLQTLDLTNNSLSVPPEILSRVNDPIAIFVYYFGIEKIERKRINQAKLIFLGQGSVGKTSLVQQILHGRFIPSQNKTEGISINQWMVDNNESNTKSKISSSETSIKLNLWDFGGQEIMHATHQFFLTKRSLYLLVLDSRLTQEENRVEYWLKIIQSFSDESPVLIVGNKIDQHPLDIDRTGLQKKYPNIVGILETSAATGAGIEELKTAITEQVNNLPHVRDLLPETWFTVKTKLEELGRQSNFITHDKYLELCAENEVSDETSQRTLIGFLHDLGVVLHFQDDPRLEALGILNPQWVTNGVYKILNSHELFQNKGVLPISMLNSILNIDGYPRDKRIFIVDMMKKFELCYEMPYGYDIEPDKTFLVPDLLPKDEPAELKFNGIPAFEYAYPVLPSSVITRFIVRMNQKIDDGFVWRTGVVLKIGENKALVKADIEDRKITIAIDGMEHTRRDALSAIRYELGEIHNSIKGLNPQQRVPVPNAPLAEPLKYEYLLKLERAGQETVLVENGNDLVTVNVRQMLSAIETEAQRKEQQGNIVNNYYNANNGGIIVGRDLSGNLLSGNYNKINSAEIDPELKDTLLQLGEAVDAMIQKLPAEQAAEVAEDFGKLADEAVKPKPNKKWYSVSIEGLIKAAENLDKLGTPVISLSRKVLSLLTGGVVK